MFKKRVMALLTLSLLMFGCSGNLVDDINNSSSNEHNISDSNQSSVLNSDHYKKKWFEPAKRAWNRAHPDNSFDYDWWEYRYPADADLEAGHPKDAPITPQKWLEEAGVGMSMKIDIPSSNGYYRYSDALIKEWKSKGFRAGRFHITPTDEGFQDLERDPTGNTLKTSALQELKETAERFVANDMPLVISLNVHKEYANVEKDREDAFYKIVNWWRQIAETLKDVNHTVVFENFVEFHGFDDQAIESEFDAKVDNNESRYPNFSNIRGDKIDNHVRSPGYNNLMAELSRVIRQTNPTRIVLYKPLGIGRYSMADVTPWRWGNEGDPLGLENNQSVYWIQSVGGSANLKVDYIYALNENNQTKKEAFLAKARQNTWGAAVEYYNQTGIPVWISLWGLKLSDSEIDTKLNGVAPGDDVYVKYVNWYQQSIQTQAYKASGERVRIPSGFQQSWWLWDFEHSRWRSERAGNLEHPLLIRDALIDNRFGKSITPRHFAPQFITKRVHFANAVKDRTYHATLAQTCAYDKGETPQFGKIAGSNWLQVDKNGTITGQPADADIGDNNFTFVCETSSGRDEINVTIPVLESLEKSIEAAEDATVQKNRADSNFGDSKNLIIRDISSNFARRTFIQFNVDSNANTIKKATLRLYSISHEGSVVVKKAIAESFDESTITWNTAPTVGETIAQKTAAKNSWIEIDVSSYVQESGVYIFAIETTVDSTGKLSSKEGEHPPVLVLSLK